ncbi:MurR/RpiR family transcriptional regulator [Hyphomicrobium sp.]|uniref:MurR/RpiR family transcriptional regulator n=1 Tax=Hyphomicrobium sp. TaxID=82 RepID=UPI0025C5EB7E|nr:MurR/RpiR family transcriptional regulator [Hyphomicrobium sp.]MCC7251081.1 MurR/RpiR family transcriptional regulator [Hyphomicrobium sp.]
MVRPNDKLSDRLRVRARGLSPSLTRVLEFIDTHRHETMTMSAVELAAAIGTSDATVIRSVQAIGFDGLKELRQALATALGSGQSPIDTITRTVASIKEHSATAIDQVFADHQETFAALASDETCRSILAAVEKLSPAKRIGVFGIGSTAFLVRYFALSLNRTGRSTAVFDDCMAPLPEQLLEMGSADALLMLAYGKPYKQATATIAEARRLKVPIVLITDTNEPFITRHADVVVPVLRGNAGRVAMHATTLVCLEALIFALVADNPARAISTLERLSAFRRSVYK